MARQGKERAAAKRKRSQPEPPQRPRPPWYPFPAAELLILAGIVAVAVGVATGPPKHSAAELAAGGAAAVIGTLEVTAREHFGGYRSHSVLLALVPTALFHGAVVLVVDAFTSFPREANLALLVADVLIFSLLWRFLQSRFQLARRQGGR